jgi:hypothetical protein
VKEIGVIIRHVNAAPFFECDDNIFCRCERPEEGTLGSIVSITLRRSFSGSFAQGGERGEKKLEAERGRVKNLFPEKAVEEILHCVQE